MTTLLCWFSQRRSRGGSASRAVDDRRERAPHLAGQQMCCTGVRGGRGEHAIERTDGTFRRRTIPPKREKSEEGAA
jgi:hypothetical protein